MKLTPTEALYIRSMGKALQVTAIARTDDEANAHMARHDRDAVVAVLGCGLVLMADKHDHGAEILDSPAARIAAAAPQLHRALADLVALVNKHGVGDDDAESEPVIDRARAALRAAT